MGIRRATTDDIDAIAATYDELLDFEVEHGSVTNWKAGLYPTRKVPELGVSKDQMWVLEEDGHVVASMMLNGQQGPGYDEVPWKYEAADDQVLVIHTLVVPPSASRHGYGLQMLDFALQQGREHGKTVCRIDTWVNNEPAKALYLHHGFRISGTVHVMHWGVIDENQVLLECRL